MRFLADSAVELLRYGKADTGVSIFTDAEELNLKNESIKILGESADDDEIDSHGRRDA